MLHVGKHLPGNSKLFKRLLETTENNFFYKKLSDKLDNYLSYGSLVEIVNKIAVDNKQADTISIDSLKRKLFVPLLNNISTGKEFVLYTLYSSLITNCKAISLYIKSEEDRKKIKYTLSKINGLFRFFI